MRFFRDYTWQLQVGVFIVIAIASVMAAQRLQPIEIKSHTMSFKTNEVVFIMDTPSGPVRMTNYFMILDTQ